MDFASFFTFESIALNTLLILISGVAGYYISTLFTHYHNPFFGKSTKFKNGKALKRQEFKLDSKMKFTEVEMTPFSLLLEDIVIKQFPKKVFLRAKVRHDTSNPNIDSQKLEDLKALTATLDAQGELINGIGYMNFTLKGLDHAKDVAKGHLMLSLNRNSGVGVYLTEDINYRGTMEIGVIELKI